MCDICGFSFTQRGLLVRHKELHNKPKKKKLPRIINKQHGNVKCELCESVFSNIVNMKSHLTKKHKHVGSTIWEMKLNTTCMKCHKTFTDVEELQAHKKTHLEFVCNICKSRYSNARSLEQHIAKHADKDRPFKCDVSLTLSVVATDSFDLTIHFCLIYNNRNAVPLTSENLIYSNITPVCIRKFGRIFACSVIRRSLKHFN